MNAAYGRCASRRQASEQLLERGKPPVEPQCIEDQEKTKSLSVNNMLHCFPVDALLRAAENAIGESSSGFLGGLGCLLAEGRAAAAATDRAADQSEIPAQARRWAQTHRTAHRVRGDRVCAAHGLSVESAAEGALWQCQRDPQTLPGVGESRRFSGALASGPCRVRRDGGHRVALAERRWRPDESTAGPRIRRAKPDGSGKKRGASECCWWTPVASHCRSSSPRLTITTSRNSSRYSTLSCCAARGRAAGPGSICASTQAFVALLPNRRFVAGTTFRTCARESKNSARESATRLGAGSSKWPTPGSTDSASCWCDMRKPTAPTSRYTCSPPPSSASGGCRHA